MKSHEGGYPGTNATRVAIAILLSQAFLAEWLLRKLTLLYDGPGAGLVKCNLMIAGIALIPLFLGIMYVVCRLTSNVLGDIAAVPALIASLLLAGIAEIGYVVVFPVLLAVVFVRRLLAAPEIPSRVKKETVVIVAGALLVMVVIVGMLYLAYQNGRFKGLFI